MGFTEADYAASQAGPALQVRRVRLEGGLHASLILENGRISKLVSPDGSVALLQWQGGSPRPAGCAHASFIRWKCTMKKTEMHEHRFSLQSYHHRETEHNTYALLIREGACSAVEEGAAAPTSSFWGGASGVQRSMQGTSNSPAEEAAAGPLEEANAGQGVSHQPQCTEQQAQQQDPGSPSDEQARAAEVPAHAHAALQPQMQAGPLPCARKPDRKEASQRDPAAAADAEPDQVEDRLARLLGEAPAVDLRALRQELASLPANFGARWPAGQRRTVRSRASRPDRPRMNPVAQQAVEESSAPHGEEPDQAGADRQPPVGTLEQHAAGAAEACSLIRPADSDSTMSAAERERRARRSRLAEVRRAIAAMPDQASPGCGLQSPLHPPAQLLHKYGVLPPRTLSSTRAYLACAGRQRLRRSPRPRSHCHRHQKTHAHPVCSRHHSCRRQGTQPRSPTGAHAFLRQADTAPRT